MRAQLIIFFKTWFLKKLWAQMSAIPKKGLIMAMQKVDKTHISLVPSLRTYERAKQEALKGHFILNFR